MITPTIGLVDGSVPVSTRRYQVVLHENAVAQLDDLVETDHTLPDGTTVTHYGIVVEGTGRIEGAEFPSDTHRIAHAGTMPGMTSRRVEVQILRTMPELWLPPLPGAEVRRAVGVGREAALFLDQMEKPLPVGLDQAGDPVYADFAFVNGEKGGHISISGISGVATKTSYALFLLYMIFETAAGRKLLGIHRPNTKAIVFNVKGEDLLHIDRRNAKFAATRSAIGTPTHPAVGLPTPSSIGARPAAATGTRTSSSVGELTPMAVDTATPPAIDALVNPAPSGAGASRRVSAAEQWASLGVASPGAFTDVRLFAPRSPRSHQGAVIADVTTRSHADVLTYGWTPWRFIRDGLLRFCFAEEDDARTQVSFVEQRVRVQLARWAYPVKGKPEAVVLCEPPTGTSYNFARIAEERRAPRDPGEGHLVEAFTDLVDFLTAKLAPDAASGIPGNIVEIEPDRSWSGGTNVGTCHAFLRRIYAQAPRLGFLVAPGVHEIRYDRAVTVIDIHSLHDSAQRFVVGALLSQIFEEKQGQGREPLRFIVLDELNKYAPREGRSPIKEVLIDIAARGRSLGVILIGAQQSAAEVDGNLIRNAAIKVAGRLDAGESSEYRFLTPELRERAARFLPGTMVFDQPLVPAPLPLRFPFPAFATCVAEGEEEPEARAAAEEEAFRRL